MTIPLDDHVRAERQGSAGLIRLDRPRALNSLTLGMVRAVDAALDAFETDAAVAVVVVMGEGERGFCAGGDIRALFESGRQGTPDAKNFWKEEFALIDRIAQYPKPYVALMDGITMGGGVGLSTHGRHRVVTERTRLAMPETAIGYFPDVGASWFLPRMPGETGTWLGLTGLEIAAGDAIFTGMADVQIASARLPDLVRALADRPAGSSAADLGALLTAFASRPDPGPVEAHRALIDRTCRFDTMDDILAALSRERDPFAEETLRILSTRSPKSLKLTLRLIRAGAASPNLAHCLQRERAACAVMLDNPDFYEGIRAAVIDKDRRPRWSPDRIDAVTEAMIDPFLVASTD